ncbi:UNKNOWN [Stylonychia lemnae]|uniref:Uncharacterized protein n=1 Tax=Stylonychia lemnae TaxID=5949 RepID=A0A078AH31_STYLE|nr:UNKNOWN [Stylonychia lemnae]|eukprot:CDW81585.1 UNKNOWN [Stylonychia lemnae]
MFEDNCSNQYKLFRTLMLIIYLILSSLDKKISLIQIMKCLFQEILVFMVITTLFGRSIFLSDYLNLFWLKLKLVVLLLLAYFGSSKHLMDWNKLDFPFWVILFGFVGVGLIEILELINNNLSQKGYKIV